MSARRSTTSKARRRAPAAVLRRDATTVVLGALAARDWRPMHHDYHFAVERNGVQGHLPEHAQPGRVVRALRHRLDRADGPARPAGASACEARCSPATRWCSTGTVPRRERRRHRLRLGRARRHAPRSATMTMHRVARRGRHPDRARRQPLGPARRRWRHDWRRAMDLDFTPEQEHAPRGGRAASARATAGLDVVRALEDDPVGYPEKFWEQLGELGLLGMTLPEQYGGCGMSMLDGVVVYQELGRALAPSPHFVSSVMSAGVLARAGSTRSATSGCRRSRGRGDRHARVARAATAASARGRAARARRADGDGWRLDGTKRHVALRAGGRPPRSCSLAPPTARSLRPRRPDARRASRSPSR